jgi:2-octaprenyl-6-methoxyphenol hydroxylase
MSASSPDPTLSDPSLAPSRLTAAAPGLRLAVVGAGPVGLALALLAAERLPAAHITVLDARPLEHDVAADARTLALAYGSVQLLQRLNAWVDSDAAPILAVHVSEQLSMALPGLSRWFASSEPTVRLRAADLGVPMLGAVLPHGRIVAPLQQAWLKACASEPQRLHAQFGAAVSGLAASASSIQQVAVQREGHPPLDADLVVVAEGGVFAEQARRAIRHDYQQTAWVGTVELQGGLAGLAFERFTRQGPVALLPLPAAQTPGDGPAAGGQRQRASLVWCTDSRDDPVAPLDEAQRLAVLATLLPPEAGRLVSLSPMKRFPLGLNAEPSLVGGPRGRVVRIGNAAQTLHPVAGQGLNLGLRDAYELIDQLARHPGDALAALRRVEWQRAPDRWALIATTDFLARSFTWQLPLVPGLRSAGLRALEALPPAKRLVAQQFMYGRR